MTGHGPTDPVWEYWNRLGEDPGVRTDGRETAQGVRFPCPCCGYLTLTEPQYGSFVICDVCFWEEDDVQFRHPDSSVGANAVSLNEARRNFREHGVSELRFLPNVRAPLPDEQP